ncbi:hypothetical protein V1Y59_10120 [Gordonia sp. PKS22-38]|uniref:Mce-associated membrane protein n=1 Tax=Gordonia prachuapensis TaxID=3115651 RepID=A0ABU7MSX8_9ACTN|nr:hypothetical protein [Gordonia sp. PKS22-38]
MPRTACAVEQEYHSHNRLSLFPHVVSWLSRSRMPALEVLVQTSTDVAESDYDLELAEAEAAAAEAEAEAAHARAAAARARARARATSLRREVSSSDDAAETTATDTTRVPIDVPDTSDTDTLPEKAPSGSDAETEPARSRPDGVAHTGSRMKRLLRAPRRPSRRAVAFAVLVAITLIALAATTLIGLHHRQTQADETRANDFTAVAERGVTAITSLDYKNAERDVERIVNQSTGEFRNDFTGRAEDFTSVIEQSKVTTKGEVTGSAVESMNADSAVVLVSARSEVTNAAGAQEEPRTWRLRVTVSDDDGTMKISKVDFVP